MPTAAIAIPGLIDSHVHITFGDYTPRQKTVGFLESYVHGGTTTAITASEVHVPGRPKDPEGVKALAVAAHEMLRDLSSRRHARPCRLGDPRARASSSRISQELASEGRLARQGGLRRVPDALRVCAEIAWAQAAGMITTVHTGGSSIPGSSGIWADHLLAMQAARVLPRQWRADRHARRGFSAAGERDRHRIAGLHGRQSAHRLLTAELLRKADQFDRLLIATDTPTGSGIMPLGMLYTISHLASLGDLPPNGRSPRRPAITPRSTGSTADCCDRRATPT